MTLVTFNQCVDNVTGVSKIEPLKESGGARHAGNSPSIGGELLIALTRGKGKGKYAKARGRYAK